MFHPVFCNRATKSPILTVSPRNKVHNLWCSIWFLTLHLVGARLVDTVNFKKRVRVHALLKKGTWSHQGIPKAIPTPVKGDKTGNANSGWYCKALDNRRIVLERWTDTNIAAVFLGAALHERPVQWACQAQNRPTFGPRPICPPNPP